MRTTMRPRRTVQHAIRMCGLACALVVIAAPKDTLAQSGPVVAEVLKDWSDLKKSTLQLADKMPADKLHLQAPVPGTGKGYFGRHGSGTFRQASAVHRAGECSVPRDTRREDEGPGDR